MLQTYLDVLGIELQPFFLIHQELLDIFALIALKLNHLSHLRIIDDCAIASWATEKSARPSLKITSCFACLVVLELTEFLLDNLEDFLLVKLLWKTLDSGQGLATISLCTPVSDILYCLGVS